MNSNSTNTSVQVSTGNVNIEYRRAAETDVDTLLTFITAMATFEKLEVSATPAMLREALFSEQPAAYAVLIYVENVAVGYLIYYFTFSSMMGKRALWLEDLYIDLASRGQGIGNATMSYLANIAVENKCARFDWIVLDWNERAINFYQRLGATILPEWRICRLQGAALEDIANEARTNI